MVRKIAASLGFIKENASKKAAFGQQVIDALTTNATTFPNLPVPLNTLSTINRNLATGVNAASTGEHVAVAALKSLVKDWDNNFRLTANYVSNVADGNASTVRLAGFVPTKSEASPMPKPNTPANFYAATNGTKGLINAQCNVADKKALVFIASPAEADINFNGDTMLITAGGVTVQVLVTTKRKVAFNNVPSNVIMDMSVYAVNTGGISSPANGQSVITK